MPAASNGRVTDNRPRMDLDTHEQAAAEQATAPSVEPAGGAEGAPPTAWSGLSARVARVRPRWWHLLVALVVLLWLGSAASQLNTTPRHEAFAAVPDTLRAIGAAVLLFGVGGFGLVRLLLPDGLRRHELLWILPTGGCAVGVFMTLLGLAHVPYAVSLVLTLLAGAAFGVFAVRRRGWPSAPTIELAWPGYLAIVVVAVAVIPMVFALHYATVTGTGSDAHMAAGAANFLKHASPTGVDISQPIDRMPILWSSKFPIYYAFAGVSTLSGLDTWQVLVPLAGMLLAFAALGLFLVARYLLGAGPLTAVAAMGLAGLDRMALHTGMNPYFNQTWGYFAMPFTLVLGWWLVQPSTPRAARRGTAILLALFALVLIDAYPLAAPIPLIPIAVFMFLERRRRIREGEQVFRLRTLFRGRRKLWLIPMCAAFSVTGYGISSKALGALEVLAPNKSLIAWGGDLRDFIPLDYFFSLPETGAGKFVLLVLLVLAVMGLRRQPRALAWGLGGLLAVGMAMAAYFRGRHYGYYFHFKILAFVAPLIIVCAVVGAARVRRWGPALIAIFALFTGASVLTQLKHTGLQLGRPTIALRAWADSLPRDASVRLDMGGGQQLWAAYFLSDRRLCSRHPLINTDYPHVPSSRRADYIVATREVGRPADAVGAPLRTSDGYQLFRENPSVPGVEHCSQRMVSRLLPGNIGG